MSNVSRNHWKIPAASRRSWFAPGHTWCRSQECTWLTNVSDRRAREARYHLGDEIDRYKRRMCTGQRRAQRLRTSVASNESTPPKDSPQENSEMGSLANYVLVITLVAGIAQCIFATFDDSEKNIMAMNIPYGRGIDSDLQFTRLLLLPPRLCHAKRNSELINSLLGLPKNVNNIGK